MKLKIALTNMVFLFLGHILYAQEIPKDTIYLEFVKNDGSLPKYLGLKFTDDRRNINFNLIDGLALYMPKESKPDTLCYKHLKDYKILGAKQVDILEKKWFSKNKKLLEQIKGKYPPPMGRNSLFVTFLIEKYPDYFLIYRVYWKDADIDGFIVIEP